MWHIHKSGASASWNDAAKGIEQLACKGVAGTRSSILQAKSDFAPVLHYWAIISIGSSGFLVGKMRGVM
jgi:hypothetical protein